MTEVRHGITLEYAIEKRRKLLQELHSDDHYESTDTLAYGDHDPFTVPMPVCDTCNERPQMQKVTNGNVRWVVVCPGCGKTIQAPQKRPWQAALMWCERNLATQHYSILPLFGLGNLGTVDARKRMTGIRRNLELRKNITGLERTIAGKTDQRPPGKDYQQRLEAYLKWAMLALSLIKYTESQQRK